MSNYTLALVHHSVDSPSKLETVSYGQLNPDEVLVEVTATGVCHTDLSCMNGTVPVALPQVFGHEGAGRVLEAGSEVSHVASGDKVLLSYAFCEKCDQCSSGHPAYCYEFPPRNFSGARPDGSNVHTLEDGNKLHSNFFGQSSFMRKAVVHRSSIVKVSEDTDIAGYAPLGCGIITGAGCVLNTLNVPSDASLAVWGCGGVGMAAIMAAKLRKVKKVIAIDIQDSRLELAKELGATDVINGKAEDIIEQIQKLCPPNGVKFALDTTGVLKCIQSMVDSLGTRGKAATIGAPSPGSRVEIDIFAHLINGREYVGCTEGDCIASKTIPYLIEEHKKGNFPVDKLITYYPIKDFQQAFDDSKSGKTIKAVLRWD